MLLARSDDAKRGWIPAAARKRPYFLSKRLLVLPVTDCGPGWGGPSVLHGREKSILRPLVILHRAQLQDNNSSLHIKVSEFPPSSSKSRTDFCHRKISII